MRYGASDFKRLFSKGSTDMKAMSTYLFAGFIMTLALFVAHAFGAQQQAGQDDGTSRKMRASRYDETARGVNAPIYAYYAEQIKKKTSITKGLCVDAGSGGGYLGLALAKITGLDFVFLDISPQALEKAKEHIVEDGLQQRARTLLADVHNIPLEDGSVDLVISRGSLPFWKDPVQAFKEIDRILAPGGQAYVGGGRGTPEIREQIAARRKALGQALPDWEKRKDGVPPGAPSRMMNRDFNEILQQTGIAKYAVNKGDDGLWIRIWK
jgi:SAM-dependent methyltransferase